MGDGILKTGIIREATNQSIEKKRVLGMVMVKDSERVANGFT